MSREQKEAWFIVGAFGLAVAVVLTIIPLAGIKFAPAGFAVFGLGGFAPLVFRKKPRLDQVEMDERDKKIAKTATLGGAMISYVTFIAACMVPWFVYKALGRKVISIHVLPNIVFIGAMVFFLFRSITLLVLYGREPRHGED